MYKLITGFVLLITLPMLGRADAPDDAQSSPVQPSASESRTASDKANDDSTGTQGGAYDICLRATQRFEQQEKDKGTGKAAIASLSASCKTELKPAKYWVCMEKEAIAEVDFNAAHWRCAKKLNH
ncbi:hypothetical protein A1353_23690 [Methylomonas methanica]|uniref:Uncharacterized protein n=1 Tax=Methylomonas methanica TaxID=421 RepID=A0A177LU48_METMH|nr:hypothetical protein [Methylomonas methanica]OAH96991.1 hypothetical protein A1353_23690 [Methylomonas methanica]